MLTKEQYKNLKQEIAYQKEFYGGEAPICTIANYWSWAETEIAEYERTNGIWEEN